MASSFNPWELASLTAKVIAIFPLRLWLNVIRSLALVRPKKLTIRAYITIATIRTLLTTFSPREIQGIVPSTRKTFHAWSESRKSQICTQSFELQNCTGAVHWLSPTSGKGSKVILFFHGGGYAVPLATGHLEWCLGHIKEASASNINLSVAVLEYTLSPGARYPLQLNQAAESLQHVIDSGFAPGDIIIGGDSAGGNLTFALLGHLLHPHPNVAKVKLSAPLAGAFGISPWFTMDMSSHSFLQNASTDMLSPALVQQSGRDFLYHTSAQTELASGAGWSLPLECPSGWWVGLDRHVHKIYLSFGAQEMFHDHVLEFGNTLSGTMEDSGIVMMDIGEGEVHDQILTDFMVGQQRGRPFRNLAKWMTSSFAAKTKSQL